MTRLLAALIFVSVIHTSTAQQYKTAVGVRGDWSSLGLDLAQFSVKHFFRAPSAIEFNLGLRRHFFWMEGMYHYNQALKNDFDWYLGAGLDLGYWDKNKVNAFDRLSESGFWGGATGVFGIEYTFDFIPLNFSLDAGPNLRLIPQVELGLKVGFSARFAFGHR